MSGRIPQSFIQDLIARTDLVEIVQARIALTRRGHNYLACCPFHHEKTPSFSVSQEKQFYYCFGCGAHGNVISFIMEFDRQDFIDVIKDLAGRNGLSLPEEAQMDQTPSHAELYPSMETATEYYEQQLRLSPEAITYLKQRGLTGKIAKEFRVGFAPARWDGLTESAGKDSKTQARLIENGLLIPKEGQRPHDRFRNRIMFPIRDSRGRVIAFGGRTIENDPAKYLNSPETPIFHKGSELYGLYEARQAYRQLARVLIVEGYMDVISLAQHDIRYAVATLGTATSAKHIQKLLRYTQELIFCFDGDRAGRQAAWRALTVTLPLMNDGIQARFMFLEANEDPDSMVQKKGKANFEQLISSAIPLSEFFFKELKEQIPLISLDSKARYAKEAQDYLKDLPTGLFQQLMKDELARILGIESSDIDQPARPPRPNETTLLKADNAQKLHAALKLAIALLIQQPSLAQTIPDIKFLNELNLLGKKLFLELLDICKNNPKITVGELLSETNDLAKSRCIAELSSWQHQVSTEDQSTAFIDALNCLEQLYKEQRIGTLIEKSKDIPLTEIEKNQLQEWLKQK